MLSRKCFELAVCSGVRGYRKSLIPTLIALRRRQKKVGLFQPQRSALLEWDFNREVKTFCKRFSLQPKDNVNDSFLTQDYVDAESLKRQQLGVEPLTLASNMVLADEGYRRLQDILIKQIHECYPKLPEQGVDAVVSHLCSLESLADIAGQMGLDPLVVRSGDGLTVQPILLRDTLLALFASIENQSEFCRRYVLIQLAGKDIFDMWHPTDVSFMLNTLLKQQNLPPYEPRLIGEAGRNTLESVFYVAVYSDKTFLGKGAGATQAAAIDMAARDALKRVFGVTRAARSPFETMALKDIRQRIVALTST